MAFRVFTFVFGVGLVGLAILSALRTFVLPRAAQDLVPRFVFLAVQKFMLLLVPPKSSYKRMDYVMAMYAPIALLACVPTWLTMVLVGYALMYWAIDASSIWNAIRESGSSLFTLGFVAPAGRAHMLLGFSQALMGPLLIALLISYLPTMYAAFSKREAAVALLEVRAGSPPSPVELVSRYHRIQGIDHLGDLWKTWEQWFVELEESHTSLSALTFFRSPSPQRSWVVASGVIMDSIALVASALDVKVEPYSLLCLRAGYVALRHIADYFQIEYDPAPKPTDPISISRQEFDDACEKLAKAGISIKADREQAWKDFAGWRVNYDTVLLGLCSLTLAPRAEWSSDRMPPLKLPPLFVLPDKGKK